MSFLELFRPFTFIWITSIGIQSRMVNRTFSGGVIFLNKVYYDILWWVLTFQHSKQSFSGPSWITTGSEFTQNQLIQSARFVFVSFFFLVFCLFFLARYSLKYLRFLLLFFKLIWLNSSKPYSLFISKSFNA